jgi:hypothetical protein
LTLIRTDESNTVRRPHGVLYAVHFDGSLEERDILVCRHCAYTWAVIPGSGKQRGWCRLCSGPLCGKTPCMTSCVPYERMIEQIEAGG